jgi:glyoxylase-like metal-dependent hydrolase (beta-lactamase superfamily II)
VNGVAAFGAGAGFELAAVEGAIATPDGGGRGNAAIVRIDGGTLVFDTGMTPQAGAELRRAAERLAPVRWVVNSHWHGDHIRGTRRSQALRSSPRAARRS